MIDTQLELDALFEDNQIGWYVPKYEVRVVAEIELEDSELKVDLKFDKDVSDQIADEITKAIEQELKEILHELASELEKDN